jgi:hypothetical protein
VASRVVHSSIELVCFCSYKIFPELVPSLCYFMKHRPEIGGGGGVRPENIKINVTLEYCLMVLP